jgi:hypothetical protein
MLAVRIMGDLLAAAADTRPNSSLQTTLPLMNIFLLWHVNESPDDEKDSKLLGAYSSRGAAEAAQKRAGQLPGFRGMPEGFIIDSYELDQDHWENGFN